MLTGDVRTEPALRLVEEPPPLSRSATAHGMLPSARVLAWAPAAATVRLVARATAEAALRDGVLHVVSTARAPVQWPSWQAAAANLEVAASWTMVPRAGRDLPWPRSVLPQTASSALVVTEAATLRGQYGLHLPEHTDLYVVAEDHPEGRSLLREPAVVVGVPATTADAHLLAVAGEEAVRRRRHLIIVHARRPGVTRQMHDRERRWLRLATQSTQGPTSWAPRVVTTRGPVTSALRNHVDTGDVLVLGVARAGNAESGDRLSRSLLEDPPCDLLLTPCS